MEQNSPITVESPNYYEQFLRKVKVDSLKIRIPSEAVEIISPTFMQKFSKVYVSGEHAGLVDDYISLENHKTDITNGITTRIGIVSSLIAKDTVKEFFYIQVNAKMCQSRYFEGINQDTIKLVYDYIMALEVIFVSFDVFLDSLISDVDFAYDVSISPYHMKELNKKIYEAVADNKKRYLDEPFKRKDNVGIVFNRREKATPSTPFIKIYHKGLEFEYKSVEFCDFYFKGMNLSNYGRLEYTLKNNKHQKYLGISIKTLGQLIDRMENERELIERIVLSGISENYVEVRMTTVDTTKKSPTDKLILWYMDRLIDKGFDKHELYGALSLFNPKDDVQRKQRALMKRKIDSLVSDMCKEEKLDKNKKVNDMIRTLNLGFII